MKGLLLALGMPKKVSKGSKAPAEDMSEDMTEEDAGPSQDKLDAAKAIIEAVHAKSAEDFVAAYDAFKLICEEEEYEEEPPPSRPSRPPGRY